MNIPQTGWVCPTCGRAVSPYVSVCPCYASGAVTLITLTLTDPPPTAPASPSDYYDDRYITTQPPPSDWYYDETPFVYRAKVT